MTLWQRTSEKLEEIPTGIVTMLFVATMAIIYISMSHAYLFIPNEGLVTYGFSPSRPLGILTYSFLHLSPQHIIANIALLIAVGVIAEKKLNPKDYLGIFFASAITAGIVFHILTPKPVVLVGASSSISGILAASIFVDIKKAVIAIILFGLFLHMASPLVTTYTENKLLEVQGRTQEVVQEYNETIKERQETQEQVQTIAERMQVLTILCEQQNQTACDELKTLNETYVNKTIEKQAIEQKEGELQKEANHTLIRKIMLEQGIEREREAKTSTVVHMVGAITGILYLALFRRDIIWKMPSQILPSKDS